MTSLTFTQNDAGKYVASFTPTGSPVAVQLQRVAKGDLVFYVSVGSMPKIVLQSISGFYAGKDFIRTVNVPSGVLVTIVSDTEVTTGGYA